MSCRVRTRDRAKALEFTTNWPSPLERASNGVSGWTTNGATKTDSSGSDYQSVASFIPLFNHPDDGDLLQRSTWTPDYYVSGEACASPTWLYMFKDLREWVVTAINNLGSVCKRNCQLICAGCKSMVVTAGICLFRSYPGRIARSCECAKFEWRAVNNMFSVSHLHSFVGYSAIISELLFMCNELPKYRAINKNRYKRENEKNATYN